MGYLADVVYCHDTTECPEPYITWSALATEGAIVGRKVWVQYGGRFKIPLNIYVTLIGKPGSTKSTGKDFCTKDILVEHFPNYILSAESQSYQHIARMMASPECVRSWKDLEGWLGPKGKLYDYRQFVALPDELELFLSTDPANMISFLVTCHSSKSFSTGFKTEEKLEMSQSVKNPYLTLLACTIPEFIMNNMKVSLFKGGLGRRIFLVYEQKTKRVWAPPEPELFNLKMEKITAHLKGLYDEQMCGPLILSPEADAWGRDWYMHPEKWIDFEDNPILDQMKETKQIMLLKVAGLIALDEAPYKMVITDVHMQTALALIDRLYPGIDRLTSGVGRNVLAGVGAELIEKVNLGGGVVSMKKFQKTFYRNVGVKEWNELLQHLISTNQIVYARKEDANHVIRDLLILPEFWDEAKQNINQSWYDSQTPSTGSTGANGSALASSPSLTAYSGGPEARRDPASPPAATPEASK